MSMMFIAAGLLIYGHFRYGNVYVAFQELKKENYDKAEKLINNIKNPNTLSKSQKSYYHFTLGLLASNSQDWEKSYSELSKALDVGLRTENDTSIALLNLANVELERKNYGQANEFIKKTRKFNLKPLIESETNRIQNEINVAQQRV